jgi:vacuolar-type H+-ATPase subunit E/Vma4
MALPDLLEALRTQAAQQRAEELGRADAEAARIGAESRASLERRRLEHVERTRREEEEAARRTVSHAEKEARASVLAARSRLLARVAEVLEARAEAAVEDPDYLLALPDEVRRGLERLPAGALVVRTPAALVDVVRDAVRGREDVAVEAADVGAGFVASVPAAGVEVDGTLRTRLVHGWPPLAVSVLAEMEP